MLADLAAVDVQQRPGFCLPAGALAQHVPVVAPRNEADLLAVALVGGGEAHGASDVADLELIHAAEWELSVSQLVLSQAVEEVALILAAIQAAEESVTAEFFLRP